MITLRKDDTNYDRLIETYQEWKQQQKNSY